MRRHIVCYVRGMRDAARLRVRVNAITDMEELEKTLAAFMLGGACELNNNRVLPIQGNTLLLFGERYEEKSGNLLGSDMLPQTAFNRSHQAENGNNFKQRNNCREHVQTADGINRSGEKECGSSKCHHDAADHVAHAAELLRIIPSRLRRTRQLRAIASRRTQLCAFARAQDARFNQQVGCNQNEKKTKNQVANM